MGGYKWTNVADGTAATDAATYGQTITAVAWNDATDVMTFTRAAGNISLDLTGAVAITAIKATGTPSASTFLRGDGAWVAGAGGGGTWGSITGTLADQTDL